MGTRRRIVLVSLLVLAVGGFAWFILHAPSEPVYQGKPLTEWLARYTKPDPSGSGTATGPEPQADEAVRALGDKTFPTLFRMLSAGDNSLRSKVAGWARQKGLIRSPHTSANVQNHQAGMAFGALGPAGSNAVPEIIRIFQKNISVTSRYDCLYALNSIGPPAQAAVPMLLEEVASGTNSFYHPLAIFALGHIRPEARQIVPTLIKCLENPNSETKLMVASLLASYPEGGAAARPVLIQLLNDPIYVLGDNAARVLILHFPETIETDVVPMLIKHLNNGHPGALPQTMEFPLLRSLGSKAKPAVPFLLQLLETGDPREKESARRALKEIDPEAAAKAGVK